MAGFGPILPTWAAQQIGSYLWGAANKRDPRRPCSTYERASETARWHP
jgi:hypothetical protein